MNSQDMSAIGAIPRKATVPVDRPWSTMLRPAAVDRPRRTRRRAPAPMRTGAVAAASS